MTVAHPAGSRSDLHTYIIAIGPSKADHHNVVSSALNEMKRVARLTLVWHGDAGGVPGPSGLGRVGLWCLGFSFCRPQSFGS